MAILQTLPAPEGIPYPQYYDTVMHWTTPATIAAVYAITVKLLNPKQDGLSRVEARKKGSMAHVRSGKFMTGFVFCHNLALCLYSAWTFVGMLRGMIGNYRHANSLLDAYCDTDQYLWHNSLGYYGYFFYLSKFYEVVDTAIIIAKGRKSSLLQTYHHAGAMMTMWAGVSQQATPIWIFVLFNSFIHTIMYFYYALTSIGLHPPGKKYLTSLQITQFLVGMTLATSYLFTGCSVTPGQQFAIALNVGYLVPLTYLFVAFAKKTYGKRMMKKAE